MHVSPSRRPYETVKDLLEHPARRLYLGYTRELTIKGQLYAKGKSHGFGQASDKCPGHALQAATDFAERHLPGSAEYWSVASLDPSYKSLFYRDVEDPETEAILWLPLAVLIAKLHYLTEFDYGCEDPIVPCILTALRHYHPSCGLSLSNFRFSKVQERSIIPYELRLLQYPSLHTLEIDIAMMNFNEDAILEAIKFMPQLKKVELRIKALRATFYKDHYVEFPQLRPPSRHRKDIMGSLSCLSFKGEMAFMDGKRFEYWTHATDFSKLHTLDMGIVQQPTVFSRFNEQVIFSSLKKLAVYLECRIQEQRSRPAMDAFFESLPPLDSLTLAGAMDSVLIQTIVCRHGYSLQDLRLYPVEDPDHSFTTLFKIVLTPEDIQTIVQACPRLQRLDLTIKRSRGDTREAACYEALSQSTSLKQVNLKLDCAHDPRSPDEMNDESLDDFDRAPYHSGSSSEVLYHIHARDSIANFAIDETLARSIWDIIRSSRRNLVSLKVTPESPRGIPSSLSGIIKHIARELHVQGNHFNDQVVISDTTAKRARMESGETCETRPVTAEEIKVNKEIMRRVWPWLSEEQNWRETWRSLSLQQSS